jgi:hypothetical protein
MNGGFKPFAPIITSVQCRTGGERPVFVFVWQPQHGYDGPFTVLVTDSAGNSTAGAITANSSTGATWTATVAMNAATSTYHAKAVVVADPSIFSAEVPLLFAPDTGITTDFDGITLSVSWTAPASLVPATKTQILLMTPAGTQAGESSVSNFGQMEVGANLRRSGGNWSVILTPQSGFQSGISIGLESAAATVYHTVPTVSVVTVFGAKTAAGMLTNVNLGLVVMVPGTSVPQTSFVGVLKADGRIVQTSAPVSGTWEHDTDASFCTTSVQFAYAMNVAVHFEVAVAQSSATVGTAIGPIGAGSGLVLLPPQAVTASVAAQGDDRIVTAMITPLGGPLPLTGSRIAITRPAGPEMIGALGLGFEQSFKLLEPSIGAPYVLFGAQASGNSIGPWSGGFVYPGDEKPGGIGLALITSIPAISAIAIDNGLASLTWGAIPDAGITGYRVSATVANAVVANAVFTGTSGNLAVTGDGVAFSIVGIASNVTGPAAAPVTAITAAPAGLIAGWTSVGTQCTLQWQAPTGSGAAPDGYKLAIYNGEILVHQTTVQTTSYAVPPKILTAAGGFSFRVAATASATPARTGPWSAPASIVSAAPGPLAVSYDGATLSATWGAVPNATGYRLVLLANGAERGDPWFAAEPKTSVPLGFDSTKTYSLAVQATGPGCAGPAVTAAVFGAGFYPQFAANTAAALIPATAPAMAPFAIAIGLPQIFISPPTGNLPSVAPFSLAAGTAPYSYVLTIAGTPSALPWTFTADAVRDDLLEAYTTFLGELESSKATAFGIQTVQAAIARAMPQTFAETLLYSYGFKGSSGWVDLRPGMVLRVEYESYQTMSAATPDKDMLNGFITSAVAQYQITRSAKTMEGFTALDAFIGLLTGLGGTKVTPPPPPVANKQAGGGGLIDSGYPLMQQAFLRLVYPLSFIKTTQPGTPSLDLNAVLIAASKLTELDTAARNIRSGAAVDTKVGVLYFRGRTTLSPQIRVWVNDVEQHVPVGTTVGQILAQRAMDPSAVDLPLTGLRLRRGIGPALVGSPAFYDVGAGAAVRLDWAPAGKAALTALPVLGGDRIYLDESWSTV